MQSPVIMTLMMVLASGNEMGKTPTPECTEDKVVTAEATIELLTPPGGEKTVEVKTKSNAGKGGLIGAGLAALTGGTSLLVGAGVGALIGSTSKNTTQKATIVCRFRLLTDGAMLSYSGKDEDGNDEVVQKCAVLKNGDHVTVRTTRQCNTETYQYGRTTYQWKSGTIIGRLK